jgi:poly-gamma-glutamate synthesis protein (capsule biosynthesis protein)
VNKLWPILVVGLAAILWLAWPQSTTTPLALPEVIAPPVISRVAVVPHHDLVAEQRHQVLTDWSQQLGSVPAIVVLSPDHFGAAGRLPLTTNRVWQTATGEVKPDVGIDRLLETGRVALDDNAFSREHGISNLLTDLRGLWPGVPVIPLILPASTDVAALVADLQTVCADCGVLASVDMSHYQPAALATLHDQFTVRALTLGDDALITQSEVDCPQCLITARRLAGESVHFVERAHTNSGDLAGNFEAETTTHIIGWFEIGEGSAVASRTMQFGGDVMLGRDIAQKYQANSFGTIWSNLGERTFWGVDFSYVNFEAPISTDRSVPTLAANNLRFIAPAVSTELLRNNHINYAGLANNHTKTWGVKILNQTEQLIKDAGVTPVGRPDEVVTTKLEAAPGRLATAVIAVNFVDGPMPGVTEAVQAATAAGDQVVVIPHWGVEYQTIHNREQEALAREWITAGADLIVGGHPHVVQDAQIINGVPVFYSLGNLIFDQYFSVETQRGLIVGAVLTEKAVEVTVVPLKEVKGRPELLRGEERTQRLEPFCTALSAGAAKADCLRGVFLINKE